MEYRVVDTDLRRYAAACVDRILTGAKPSDLLVQQPSRFNLVINLKTTRYVRKIIPAKCGEDHAGPLGYPVRAVVARLSLGS
jgi:hypothetical protein